MVLQPLKKYESNGIYSLLRLFLNYHVLQLFLQLVDCVGLLVLLSDGAPDLDGNLGEAAAMGRGALGLLLRGWYLGIRRVLQNN